MPNLGLRDRTDRTIAALAAAVTFIGGLIGLAHYAAPAAAQERPTDVVVDYDDRQGPTRAHVWVYPDGPDCTDTALAGEPLVFTLPDGTGTSTETYQVTLADRLCVAYEAGWTADVDQAVYYAVDLGRMCLEVLTEGDAHGAFGECADRPSVRFDRLEEPDVSLPPVPEQPPTGTTTPPNEPAEPDAPAGPTGDGSTTDLETPTPGTTTPTGGSGRAELPATGWNLTPVWLGLGLVAAGWAVMSARRALVIRDAQNAARAGRQTMARLAADTSAAERRQALDQYREIGRHLDAVEAELTRPARIGWLTGTGARTLNLRPLVADLRAATEAAS